MSDNGHFKVPTPYNEPVRTYEPGTAHRFSVQQRLAQMTDVTSEIPMTIGGERRKGASTRSLRSPHRHELTIGEYQLGAKKDFQDAVDAALTAQKSWAATPFHERAAILLRAAALLAGPWRDTINAATMLGQSKTIHQAEIDAAAELCDFLRFNVAYMTRIYQEQPESSPGVWNRMEYRPLEGFVLAVTPFNFTSIAGNLPTSAALMGCTVVWKPSESAAYSAHYLMRLFQAAGLPDGVINLVHGPGGDLVPLALASPDLAGVHFTGSTAVFRSIWSQTGENIASYRNFPRLVGETGGKDFIVAHASADVDALGTAVVRGSFEYQGQKCSAASRVFVPDNLWPELRERLAAEVESIPVGDVADFRNFMGAVINERSFRRQAEAIEEARSRPGHSVLAGGGTDSSKGWFVQPTVVVTEDAGSRLLRDELFGPVVTVYVYPEGEYEPTLDMVDRSVPFGLTGAVFAEDRVGVRTAQDRLRYTAGNFYVNDKPTGAVVSQQPFG